MFEICKEIYNEQAHIMDDVSKMGAMDIGCGYHSYLFAIARCQKQVSHILYVFISKLTQASNYIHMYMCL